MADCRLETGSTGRMLRLTFFTHLRERRQDRRWRLSHYTKHYFEGIISSVPPGMLPTMNRLSYHSRPARIQMTAASAM